MPKSSESNIYDVFARAAKMADVAQRDALIEAHCRHDEALIARLQAMLAVREEADQLFENALATAPRPDAACQPEAALGRVGRFRLERLVGRGGMGNVFLDVDEHCSVVSH